MCVCEREREKRASERERESESVNMQCGVWCEYQYTYHCIGQSAQITLYFLLDSHAEPNIGIVAFLVLVLLLYLSEPRLQGVDLQELEGGRGREGVEREREGRREREGGREGERE